MFRVFREGGKRKGKHINNKHKLQIILDTSYSIKNVLSFLGPGDL